MAKQTGIIKLKGTIGRISFYKTGDGHLAREKGGVDKSRIQNDTAFQRTQENGSELDAEEKVVKFYEMPFVCSCKMQKTNVW